MVKPEWGTKRTCPKCGVRFYDLGKEDPVTCIACGINWNPEPVLKSKQPLPFEAAAKPEAEKEKEDSDLASDDDLDIDENCIMVLKYCGPKGYPGMAEVGNMGLPPKVLKKGITDMIRISDARMSGTAYGTVILHAAPEAADGGPLALIENGDMISVDVPARAMHLEVSDEELARRRAAWVKPHMPVHGGYGGLYINTVMQADQGADLDFLVGKRGADIPLGRDSH